MTELKNEDGIVCASMDIIPEDGEAWAIVVSWKRGVDGVPDAEAWSEAMESTLGQCKERGAIFIDSRVITASEGVAEALVTARAAMHRDFLRAHGFRQGEGRVEYSMGVDEALAALEAGQITAQLAWNCIDTDSENELARAAEFVCRVAEGDPASHAGDDALGFLKTLLDDQETVKAAERLQIGSCEGSPAALIALMAYAGDGWSSIYYMGVLPGFRGRGFGAEAMLRGLLCLKAMGGRTYHDGTGSRNAAARALFARLGKPPFRVLEEWRLGE
ncbi:MAG: GNAT family N-acetyltransferase [bacterium]